MDPGLKPGEPISQGIVRSKKAVTLVDTGGGSQRAGLEVKIVMVDNAWRIYYGNSTAGRYVGISSYDEIADFVIGRRPKEDLIGLYFGGDDGS